MYSDSTVIKKMTTLLLAQAGLVHVDHWSVKWDVIQPTRVLKELVQWVMKVSHWPCLLHPSHKVNAKELLVLFKRSRG